jgi:hypothetical protein
MTRIGYFRSSEQFGPKELVDQAKRARAAGFNAGKYIDADIDEVYVQQIGPDMEGFFAAWEQGVPPQLRG